MPVVALEMSLVYLRILESSFAVLVVLSLLLIIGNNLGIPTEVVTHHRGDVTTYLGILLLPCQRELW